MGAVGKRKMMAEGGGEMGFLKAVILNLFQDP
jgi:hypothetical protein